MVIKHHVSGFQAFQELIGGLKGPLSTHVYFTGSKDPTGESWCPDCNQGKSPQTRVRNQKPPF